MSRKVLLRERLPALQAPFRTVVDVENALSVAESVLVRAGDRRGVFATAYLLITRELERRIAAGGFEDPPWVERYLLAFANLYREALWAGESDGAERVAEPWRIAFAATDDPLVLMPQHLLLGINAHIAHDLPLALLAVTPEPDAKGRAGRHRDHTAINVALAEVTDAVQDRLTALYAPAASLLDLAAGSLDELLGGLGLAAIREAAWRAGVALIDAPTPAARAAEARRIELEAARAAHWLLAPSRRLPDVAGTLSAIEALHAGFDEILAGVGWGAPVPARESGDPCAVLARRIAMLETRIIVWDDACEPRAALGALQLSIARRVEESIATGSFDDPSWVAEIEAGCIAQFLRADAARGDPATEPAPRCWSVVFAALAGEETILVQDLVLALAVRLHHDLPRAIASTRATGGRRRTGTRGRRPDLERLGEILDGQLARAIEVAAERYRRAVLLADEVRDCCLRAARELDVRAACRAAIRRGADADAPADLDRSATAVAHRIFAIAVQRPHALASVLRAYERRSRQPWSSWVLAEAPRGSFERQLGERLRTLPLAVRSALDGAGGRRLSGALSVAVTPPLAWLAAALPIAARRRSAPVSIDVVRDPEREIWLVGLPEATLVLEIAPSGRYLRATHGILALFLEASVLDGKLLVRSRGAALAGLGLALPWGAAPALEATLAERDGCLVADVSLRLPLLGSVHAVAELAADT